MEKPGALTGGGGEVRVCACFGAFGSRGVCMRGLFAVPVSDCVFVCFAFRFGGLYCALRFISVLSLVYLLVP